MNRYDLADEILVPAIGGLLGRHIPAVRAEYGGRLPRLRTDEFITANDHTQLTVLALAGTSWLWGPPGSAILRDAARDVRGTEPEFSRHRPSFAELQHRRGLRSDDDTRRWVVAS
jgi:hypothetical protein